MLYSILFLHFDSKWIKDLNLRTEMMNLLKEYIKETLQDIGLGDDPLNKTSKTQATNSKTKQMGLCQTHKLLTMKGSIVKIHPTAWNSSQNKKYIWPTNKTYNIISYL